MSEKTSTEHLFWARELVRLSREEAAKKGVPAQVMAHAMLVQAFMLFTGQPEEVSAEAVKGLYASSLAKHVKQGPAKASLSAN
jgi:TRAP-type uncharacterized transport system fused permease subunit